MGMETERVEFKSRVTDDLCREVIAFANTNGGVIYVGIDDRGNVVGLEDVDTECARVTNSIRDAIVPDVTMFIRYVIREDRVLCIEVSEGTNKPYYLRGKGLRPGGVYVRQGTSCVPASVELIRQMIKDSDGDTYEAMRSVEQNLTFDAASAAFKRYNVEFGEEKYRALGIIQPSSGLFSNLGLLLSDQCAHTIKIAVFGDDDNTVFKDRKEFGGSILAQLEGAFDYLMLCNRTTAVFKGLERLERVDYPEGAIREALLNAIVHRDYGYSGSIIINVNENNMEFISLGGLLPGLSPEDIRTGISQPRNRKLAEIFYRLRLIESYGTGIRRIFKLYAGCALQPRIEVSANTFKIVLPNMNAAASTADRAAASAGGITEQMQRILREIREQGQIDDGGIQALLGVKKTRAYNCARQMLDMGLIRVEGKRGSRRYVLNG